MDNCLFIIYIANKFNLLKKNKKYNVNKFKIDQKDKNHKFLKNVGQNVSNKK